MNELTHKDYKEIFHDMMLYSEQKLIRDKDNNIFMVYYPEGYKASNEPVTNVLNCIGMMSGYIQDQIINDIYDADEDEILNHEESIQGLIKCLEDNPELLEKTRFNYDVLSLVEEAKKKPDIINIQEYFHSNGKEYPNVDDMVYQDDNCNPPFCEEGAGKRLNKMFTPIVSIYNVENNTVTYSTEEKFDSRQAAIELGQKLMASGAIEGFSLYNEDTGLVEYSEGLSDIDDVLEACGGYVDIEMLNNGGITVDAPKSEGFPEKQEQKKKTIQERD